jgi:hypothetical protein
MLKHQRLLVFLWAFLDLVGLAGFLNTAPPLALFLASACLGFC